MPTYAFPSPSSAMKVLDVSTVFLTVFFFSFQNFVEEERSSRLRSHHIFYILQQRPVLSADHCSIVLRAENFQSNFVSFTKLWIFIKMQKYNNGAICHLWKGSQIQE